MIRPPECESNLYTTPASRHPNSEEGIQYEDCARLLNRSYGKTDSDKGQDGGGLNESAVRVAGQ
jgi:hypothetical protein